MNINSKYFQLTMVYMTVKCILSVKVKCLKALHVHVYAGNCPLHDDNKMHFEYEGQVHQSFTCTGLCS